MQGGYALSTLYRAGPDAQTARNNIEGGDEMAKESAKAPPSAKRDRIKAFVPALVDYTNDVVYGDLWER